MREQGVTGPPAAWNERGVYDVVGIGFGPANMALAVTMEEAAEEGGAKPLRRLFLEARREHSWHPGMLLRDSLIQISVLKDLATVRNPRSRFTFLNYLKEKGRLFEFLNLRDLFPTRIEFNDYLGWVAEILGERVRYGRRVVSVTPLDEPGSERVHLLEVTARDEATGERERYRTRDLVLATGGTPWLPQGIEVKPGGRAFHAHQFRERVERDFADRQAAYRFVVVGAGQSGAELFYYLATRYPNADVTAAIRGYAYKPVDDSDFTNEVFFPEMVDFVYDLPDDRRKGVVDSFRDVNYAVVDAPLIRKIYRLLYDEKVEGKARCRIRPYQELRSIQEGSSEVTVELEHVLDGQRTTLTADGLVLATGYRWDREHPLLRELAPYFERDGDGSYKVERDYRLAASPSFEPRVYVQGFCEDTHGLSETVLSLLPVRAQNIFDSLRHASRRGDPVERLAGGGAGV